MECLQSLAKGFEGEVSEALSEYVSADASPEAELSSLAAHSKFFEWSRASGLTLTTAEKQSVLQVMEELYAPARYALRPDFASREHFDEVILDLDMTSSPGYPYSQEASTIGEWLGWNGYSVNVLRAERLWQETRAFLNGDFPNLYRVFVKTEPHKLRKAREGRWRLIICPPLCEQVAWTMWFGQGNDLEIKTCGLTPSLQGIKLVEGYWKDYNRLFREKGMDSALDKSAWDWTAHIEWIMLDLEHRYRLMTAEAGTKRWWREIAERLYENAFIHPRLLLSNGDVWEQQFPGVMKSGCVNTISTNSHCQVLVHVWLSLKKGTSVYPVPFAVGDDTLGAGKNAHSVTDYALAAVKVKEGSEAGLQFVGHDFDPNYVDPPLPAYTAKHFRRYLEVRRSALPSFLESMARMYAHNPKMAYAWRALAMKHEILLSSEDYCVYWYDTKPY